MSASPKASRSRLVGVALAGIVLGVVCAAFLLPARQAPPRPDIVVTIPPLAWLAQRLAPELEVRTLVPVGVSPHAYQLTPRDASDLRSARVVMSVGPFIDDAARRVIDARVEGGHVSMHDVATRRATDGPRAHVCTHEIREPDAMDPHLWLDPHYMADGAIALADELVALGLLDEPTARARALAIVEEIAVIDAAFHERLGALGDRQMIVYHDAYRLWVHRYGLAMPMVLRTNDHAEVTPGAIASARAHAEANGVRAIYAEPQFAIAGPKRLAEALGIELMMLDPVGGEDWPAMMRANLEALERGLSREAL
ncbi:MAG: metal ABC transporter substrate-binding protein [Planctomycetota bacterium]